MVRSEGSDEARLKTRTMMKKNSDERTEPGPRKELILEYKDAVGQGHARPRTGGMIFEEARNSWEEVEW